MTWALALAAAWGMGKAPPPAQEAAPMAAHVQEWKGQFCGVAGEKAVLVTDAAGWAALWKEAFGREAPDADFAAHVAVAAFAGSKNTGGYVVEFQDPETSGGGHVLRWRVKSPGKGGFVIQAFTQPYAVRLYPKPAGPVTLERAR